MLQRIAALLSFLLLTTAGVFAQTHPTVIRTASYRQLQQKLATGWNTWYNNSMLTHAWLPGGFAINLGIETSDNKAYLRETYKLSDYQQRPEKLYPGLRADDGSYTSIKLEYMGMQLTIESATDANDECILVTPAAAYPHYLLAEAAILWNKEGSTALQNGVLKMSNSAAHVSVYAVNKPVQNTYAYSVAPHLTFLLNEPVAICTGKPRSLAAIQQIISHKRKHEEQRVAQYGQLSESFTAMQNILAWNTIYDAGNNRVITPVSRAWNQNWGGFVMFEWDSYFAANMLALFNKNLAYANAVEMTKAITDAGLVPNFQSVSGYQAAGAQPNLYGRTSWDRSEPPVGSLVVWNIYAKYHEKWFLQEVYDELLTWNRWWHQQRNYKGYLAWGSYDANDTAKRTESYLQSAAYESGLDDSPMYDSVGFNRQSHTMKLADVGLMSLYIRDCKSLALMAKELGKNADATELEKRAADYSKQLATLWNEPAGIYLNKRLDTDAFSYRISPTNLYPLLAGVCTQQQAQTMMDKYYFDSTVFYGEHVLPSIARSDPAFKDNSYWRGRIWAPMNFLVYLGMRQYDLPKARKDLVERSEKLLLKNWRETGGVYENYNAVTGQGSDVHNADGFYHWGALLGFIRFMEEGYMR